MMFATNIPPIKGYRYERLVPDTIDIADYAESFVATLTATATGEYSRSSATGSMPLSCVSMIPARWNWGALADSLQSVLLLRDVTGSELNLNIDRVWIQALVDAMGSDRLWYSPLVGDAGGHGETKTLRAKIRGQDGQIHAVDDGHMDYACGAVSNVVQCINAFSLLYLHDQDLQWLKCCDVAIARLGKLCVDKGGYGYFLDSMEGTETRFQSVGVPGSGGDSKMPTGYPALRAGSMVEGLSRYYRITNCTVAEKLSRKLACYLMHHAQILDGDGQFLCDHGGDGISAETFISGFNQLLSGSEEDLGNYCHRHLRCLVGLAEFALANQDEPVGQFVKKGFEWARAQLAPCIGVPLQFAGCSSSTVGPCDVADMIWLAMMLSKAGVGDYWEDADRWIRCHLGSVLHPQRDSKFESVQSAAGSVGILAGRKGAESPGDSRGAYPSCEATWARMIYRVWYHTLEFSDNAMTIHLLMNRGSRWVDIDSYLPYEGRVDFHLKDFCRYLRIHVPQWIPTASRELRCTLNGQPSVLEWQGRYVKTQTAHDGDRLTITFPVPSRVEVGKVSGRECAAVLKGNDLVRLDHLEGGVPLYQYNHLLRHYTPWRHISRFDAYRAFGW